MRRWRARLETARRDARMVADGLLGRRPPYLVPRRGGRRSFGAPPPAIRRRTLRVARVVRETPDAVTVFLADASGAPLRHAAGQFLTVEVDVGGERLRRAYSLSSAPRDAERSITVKRVAGGRVSGWINDHLAAGDVLRALGPSGSFTVEPDPDARRCYVMLAGGSGITPIWSIAREVLAAEPGSRVTLVYGNRREEDVIFRDAIDALAQQHPDRFTVDHVLSDPPDGWSGGVGLLDRDTVACRLDRLGIADGPDVEWLLCGPDPMRSAVREVLSARVVPPARVREEVFVRPERRASARVTEPQDVVYRVDGVERRVTVRPGATLLEAGLGAELPMPFSCTMGGCGACRLKLVDGEVDSDEPNCLTDEERAEGWVLTCVSRPRRACVLEEVPS